MRMPSTTAPRGASRAARAALAALALLAAACAGDGDEAPPAPAPSAARTAEASPAASASGAAPAPEATAAASASDAGPAAEADASPIGDAEAAALLAALGDAEADKDALRAALARIVAADDERFASVLIELLWARDVGVLRDGLDYTEYADALEALTGAGVGTNRHSWVEWYGATDLEPPPGFTAWKGRLMSPIDPRFAEFLSGEQPSRIRVEEVLWGGVRVDSIPPLDRPRTVAPEDASYLEDDDAVFGIAIGGEAHAYPLRILDWHEMANVTVGGVPISLAYCTLCGAAIAWDGRAPDGATYDFGTSGFLYRSNKLMYDRPTGTLWNQFTGEPVLGPLAGAADADGEPLRLALLPVVLTTWSEWLRQHPETVVLDVDTGYDRPYQPGAAYGHYFSQPDTMFPVWSRSPDLRAKDYVYGLRVGGARKAWPVEALAAERVVNDEVGGLAVVLVAAREVETLGYGRFVGPVLYPSGGEVRAYERGDRVFAPAAGEGGGAGSVADASGAAWTVTEDALVGPGGERLARVGGHLAYWFGWYAFYPDTELYGRE